MKLSPELVHWYWGATGLPFRVQVYEASESVT